MSEWHCAVGSIRYDRQRREDVAGTLLYIKSSLTGDEPTDVLRYAAEHPAFPHESTNDQFFDESQFESYRALGYHIAHEVFGPALARARRKPPPKPWPAGRWRWRLDELDLFTRLGQVWAKPAPSPPNAVHRYSGGLDPHLEHDAQHEGPAVPRRADVPRDAEPHRPAVRPVAASRAAPPRSRRLPVNYWLPPSADERRAGFYICNEMLQLMEDVFLEFDLDQYYDHIDNRGWMNLFQHWAWSGMLCATWAMTGSMFDPRFQRFCRSHLDSGPGTPGVATVAAGRAAAGARVARAGRRPSRPPRPSGRTWRA